MIKRLIFAMLIFICVFTLTGCYDYKEVDDQCYAVVIGLDKGKITPLRVTVQYAQTNPMSSSGGGSGGGGGGNPSGSNVGSVTFDSITVLGALTSVNQFIGKELNLSHALVLVISEELAKEGISKYMYALARNKQYRPTMYVATCRGSVEKYINSIAPTQEADPSKYYQLLFETYSYTGFSTGVQFYRFYEGLQAYAFQPVTNLVAVGKYNSSNEFTEEGADFKEKGHHYLSIPDFKAGDLPRIGNQKGELMGLAVYDGDKFVGELDGEGALCYLMVIGDLKQSFYIIEDPHSEGNYIILIIKQSRRPERVVNIKKDQPDIKVKIHLEGDISVIHSGHNYEDLTKLSELERKICKQIKNDIEYYLNKTAIEFKSDIYGFGNSVRKNFLTWDKWKEYNWLSKYEDSSFDVQVDVKVRRPGLMLRSTPVINSETEE